MALWITQATRINHRGGRAHDAAVWRAAGSSCRWLLQAPGIAL